MTRIAEDELLERIRRGDERAFEALWSAYFRECRNAASALGHGGGREEDAAQATMIQAWLRMSTFRGDAPFGAWVRAILRNVIWQTKRGAYARLIAESYDALPDGERDALLRDDRNPERIYAAAEFERLAWREMRRLPRPYAEVLLAAVGQRRRVDAAMTRVGISRSAAKNRLARAHRILHKRLETL
jgi:RNA polymerase sigma-70 factor (ECF subfamily)